MTVDGESSSGLTRLDSALQNAALGRAVFPAWCIENGACACGDSGCRSPGKHPIGELVPKGHRDATCDEATIRDWWGRYPRANVGWALGDRFVVLDLDPRNGSDASMATLESRGLYLSKTLTARTGGGGKHHIYRVSDGVEIRTWKLADGIDVKGCGRGYIIIEPSNHISGGTYEWENWPLTPVELDDWVVDALSRDATASASRSEGPYVPPETLSEGERHTNLLSLAGKFRYAGLNEPEILAGLRAVNAARGNPPQDDADVVRIARDYAQKSRAVAVPNDVALVEALRFERNRREARRILDAEQATRAWSPPPSTWSLVEELAIEDGPLRFTIEHLLPEGSNALVVAQYKTGKTTLGINALESLSAGAPFLRWAGVIPQRVAFWNYEMSERQFRDWLRRHRVTHPELVSVLNLRGHRWPFNAAVATDEAVKWLHERQVQTWIIDPFARAYSGFGSENDNDRITEWTEVVDEIKQRAGITNVIVFHHTGRQEQAEGEEHGRGGSRLDDWPDVRWVYTKERGGTRHLYANGRDVDVEEFQVDFDPATLRLTARQGSRRDARASRTVQEVVDAILKSPQRDPETGRPRRSTTGLMSALGGRAESAHTSILEAVESGRVVRVSEGAGRSTWHYVAERREFG